MHEMDLRTVDLNLLVVVDAVLRERNLTRTAASLHMSQPAVSHALSRAREMFSDRLLVRSGNAMTLTPRGIELSEKLPQVLREIQTMLATRSFDPAELHGHATIAVTEGATVAVLSEILAQISALAPGLGVHVSSEVADAYAHMRDGGVDILVDVALPTLPSDFRHEPLFANELVCMYAAVDDATEMTSAEYLSRPHAVITGGTNDYVNRALRTLNVDRRVQWEFPGFISAACVVARTDLVLTVPHALARMAATLFPLTVSVLPFRVPPVTLALVWHERQNDDPAQLWLRNRIISRLADHPAVVKGGSATLS